MMIRPLDNRTYYARLAFTRLERWRTHHFTASQSVLMMCSLDIIVDLQPLGLNFKWGILTPVRGFVGAWGTRFFSHAHGVPISFPMAHKINKLLPFLIYISGSKRISVRSFDPNTMTIAVQEAIV